MIEDAARTQEDFEKVLIIWNEIEIIEDWRIGKQELQSTDELHDYELPERDTIIPPPLEHIWWRELLKGNFLDVIFDCPHEIHELSSSRPTRDFTKELDENRKEILYYWAIRQWSPQKIAAIRRQTDRNIRKVYNKMIEEIRRKMFERLYPRIEKKEPLTLAQREFVKQYIEQSKTTIDGGKKE